MDTEFPGSISTRKLVIETAKFNVITAYSTMEAVATLERFPNVDAVVLNAAERGTSCADMVKRIRALAPKMPLIVTSATGEEECGDANHILHHYDPATLLETLRKLFHSESAEILLVEKKLTEESERMEEPLE